jgi:D-galacturonate reductase
MGCDPRTEDTITLLVDWQNVSDPKQHGTAVYTASWAAPLKAGVHSEQRFHYMAAKGEVRVDQAHRGYSVVEDDVGKLDVSGTWGLSGLFDSFDLDLMRLFRAAIHSFLLALRPLLESNDSVK